MPQYIPKYIIRRMFPKDCAKKVEGGVEITMMNIISPIKVSDELPEDIENYINANIDGKPITDEVKKGIALTILEKKYDINNFKELVGVTIPVGSPIKIFAPYTAVEVGEEHEVDIDITDTDFKFTVKRVIQ
ncbi:MAG: hypothetical protein ACFFCS_02425 [Candidatus Hodarchaeota archaeon]